MPVNVPIFLSNDLSCPIHPWVRCCAVIRHDTCIVIICPALPCPAICPLLCRDTTRYLQYTNSWSCVHHEIKVIGHFSFSLWVRGRFIMESWNASVIARHPYPRRSKHVCHVAPYHSYYHFTHPSVISTFSLLDFWFHSILFQSTKQYCIIFNSTQPQSHSCC